VPGERSNTYTPALTLSNIFLRKAGTACIIIIMTDQTPQTQHPSKPHILVVGGGFAGVKTALELSKHHTGTITLLSDKETFSYYPALYHTATGGLYKQSNIPLKRLVNEQKINFVQGSAHSLSRQDKILTTDQGQQLHYDILVLALGVVTNYFGIKGLEENSYTIKSWEQIQKFKHHLHSLLTPDTPEQHYVIVGAGPTGIEVAGALPAYLRKIMKKHGVTDQRFKITIIEAAPRLLPHSAEKVSRQVSKRLAALGVDLQLGMAVQGASANELMVNGSPIKSSTIIWTAGTSNHPFFKENNFTLTEHGKVQVDDYLHAEDDIYVIGDNAQTPFSGFAQTAVRDGMYVAHDIVRRLKGKQTPAYKPKKPIAVIPVGEGWASVEWGKSVYAGMFGWWLRSAADWVAFHDVEPWWRATTQWATEFGGQEDCAICSKQ